MCFGGGGGGDERVHAPPPHRAAVRAEPRPVQPSRYSNAEKAVASAAAPETQSQLDARKRKAGGGILT